MSKVELWIDDKKIAAEQGMSILDAALKNGIYIPHLCHHKDLHPDGACRLCVVEQEGVDEVVTSCEKKVEEGMVIHTKTKRVEEIRKLSVDLMFKTHPEECGGCVKYGKCQLQSISQYVGDTGRDLRKMHIPVAKDEKNPLLVHEMYRCILCGRCVRACSELRGVGALRFEKVNGRLRVVIDGDSLEDADCRFCGACAEVCPTGAIHDKLIGETKLGDRKERLISCYSACPAHVDVPEYIRFIKEGDYSAAAAVIHEKVPFPECLGYICVHKCESACKRNHLNDAVSIRNLKRFAAEHDDGSWKEKRVIEKDTGKSVAIVGAGPAGMTAAYYLRKKGHQVTVFEKLPETGGQMRYGIPAYRLPRTSLEKEMKDLCEIGIEVKTNTEIRNVEELKKMGFDAVFLAMGTHKGNRLPIKGNDLQGCYVNCDYLRSIHLGKPQPTGEKVVVLGGGNVAIDCAGSALRLGAKEVHMVCLESEDKMTSSKEEILWAKEEGVKIHNSKTFNEILGKDGIVTGLSVTSVKDFYFKDGRLILEKEDDEEIIPADTIIFAVGQGPEITEGFGVALGRGNRILVNEGSHETSMEGVYAAGDAVTGTNSVIQAIAGAREAAQDIDVYLGGDGIIDEKLAPVQKKTPYIGKRKGFSKINRNDPDVLSPEKRRCSFEKMDHGFSADKALAEASRCLQCDLRCQIEPQKFWSDYEGGSV